MCLWICLWDSWINRISIFKSIHPVLTLSTWQRIDRQFFLGLHKAVHQCLFVQTHTQHFLLLFSYSTDPRTNITPLTESFAFNHVLTAPLLSQYQPEHKSLLWPQPGDVPACTFTSQLCNSPTQISCIIYSSMEFLFHVLLSTITHHLDVIVWIFTTLLRLGISGWF